MNRQQADKLEQLKQNLINIQEGAFYSERYDDTEEARQHNNSIVNSIRAAEKELIDYQATLM